MDAKLRGDQIGVAGFPEMDFYVDTSVMDVPVIADAEEDQQQANLAATIMLGAIPQIPDTGVDWPGFLTESITFPQADAQVRSALKASGHPDYFPSYDLVNGLFTIRVNKNGGGV